MCEGERERGRNGVSKGGWVSGRNRVSERERERGMDGGREEGIDPEGYRHRQAGIHTDRQTSTSQATPQQTFKSWSSINSGGMTPSYGRLERRDGSPH